MERVSWLEVATAPKDGTTILARQAISGKPALVFWDGEFWISQKQVGWGSTSITGWFPIPD